MAIDTSSLSGYALSYANARNSGASDSAAHAAATGASGGGNYSYFGPTGLSSGTAAGFVQSPISLLPDPSNNAIVKDAKGNPWAVDFSQPNWQTAWTDEFGAGNQLVTGSTNLSNIGKSIGEVMNYSNSNPLNWTQQAAGGYLTNSQGKSMAVSPTVRDLAQTALNTVNADNGAVQGKVNSRVYELAKMMAEKENRALEPEYENLLQGNYTVPSLIPLTHEQVMSQNFDQMVNAASLTAEERAAIANMSTQERANLMQTVFGW